MRAEEGPKKDEVKDNKGRDNETEKSIEIASKVQTDMDVSHHEDRCFACKDGGGEFFFLLGVSRLCSSHAASLLNHSF